MPSENHPSKPRTPPAPPKEEVRRAQLRLLELLAEALVRKLLRKSSNP
jgi:hypothetical protein